MFSCVTLLVTISVNSVFPPREYRLEQLLFPYKSSECLAYIGTGQVSLLECCAISVHSREGQKRKWPLRIACIAGWAQRCRLLSPAVMCLGEGAQKLLAHTLYMSSSLPSQLSGQGLGFHRNLYQAVINKLILILKHTVVSIAVSLWAAWKCFHYSPFLHGSQSDLLKACIRSQPSSA